MPNYNEGDRERQLGNLEQIASQQADLTKKMADQIAVLFAINTALIGTLRNQVDIEFVRTQALGVFNNQAADPEAVVLINAMLGPAKTTSSIVSEEALNGKLGSIVRGQLAIIDGGRKDEAQHKPTDSS